MREIVQKRRIHSKTFSLGEKKFLLRTGIRKPLHRIAENGALEDIDLVPVLDRGRYFIGKAPYKAWISADFPEYKYAGSKGEMSAALVAINGNSVGKRDAEYDNGQFIWKSVSLYTDCIFIPRNAGLNARVLLHSSGSPRKFSWEILGNTAMMQPVRGADAKGRPLELIQSWDGNILNVEWTGKVIDKRAARRKEPLQGPVYPVWIDPTVNENITAGADDASTVDWSLSAGYTDIWVGNDPDSVVCFAGLRFQGVAIPQGVTINSAVLTLYIIAIIGSPHVKIYANDVDSAGAWSSGNLIRNITKTTAYGNITPSATGSNTVGVTSVIQEIVNRTGFNSANAMALAGFNAGGAGNNFFKFAAYEHGAFPEAQLDIVYSISTFRPHLIMF